MDRYRQAKLRNTIEQLRRMADASCQSIAKSQKALIDARREIERQQKQIASLHEARQRREYVGLRPASAAFSSATG